MLCFPVMRCEESDTVSIKLLLTKSESCDQRFRAIMPHISQEAPVIQEKVIPRVTVCKCFIN